MSNICLGHIVMSVGYIMKMLDNHLHVWPLTLNHDCFMTRERRSGVVVHKEYKANGMAAIADGDICFDNVKAQNVIVV